MKKLSFFLLLLILQIISHVDSQAPPPPPLPPRAPLMWYVLTWPPTYCLNLKSPDKCKEPIPDREFTLHGLWPADKDGKTITCDISVDLDWVKLFKPIEGELEKFWPTLLEGARTWGIWKHEYRSHGICGGLEAEEYFNAAIRINNKIKKGNLFYYLKTSGIIACESLTFTRYEIINAVQKVFPTPPLPRVYLRCLPNSKDPNVGHLSEVVLCTDLDGNGFISCPDISTTCDPYNKIMLPQSTTTSQGLQEEIDEPHPEFELSWAKYIFSK
ncbi:intracellular ribonuclease LX [Capsicum galapagoense]